MIKSRLKAVRLLPELRFLVVLVMGWLVMFSVLRAGLLWRNNTLAAETSLIDILLSLVVGSRFDLAIASMLVVPLALWMLIPRIGWQYRARSVRMLPWLLIIVWSPLVFVCLAEWEFYREFHERFNQLAIQYLVEDAATVGSMVWHGYPVIPYVLLWLGLATGSGWLLFSYLRNTRLAIPYEPLRHWRRLLPSGLALLLLLVVGARGGLQGNPLQWGDAYFSKSSFANHIALNGVYMLGIAALEKRHTQPKNNYWTHQLPPAEAVAGARRLLVQPGDTLLSDEYPLLRRAGHGGRQLSFSRTPRNVVVILMESFSAEFIGSLGSDYGATPVFDRLTGKGILFDHFFSQGTHTHQGLFATVCSFPNLPGYEYLMQNSHGQQPFRSFISVLGERGYESTYLYNGSFSWDNQEGFFRNQGMQHFIGRDDYINPVFMDPTWGVSDEDMFVRGEHEINILATHGPVFALLQTVSNHPPFNLPAPAPFADLKGPDVLKARLNGVRYADWALGRFFELAGREKWFRDTLFVILGDHGFGYGAPQARLDLARYHVPLLLYYPGDASWLGRHVHTVGSQVDVLPTVLGLVAPDAIHQSWGRDLLRLSPAEPGWAIIKPSGDGQMMGLVEGERLTVVAPGMTTVRYTYQLNPWRASLLPDASLPAAETGQLFAYVETAMMALTSQHAGAPPPAVASSSVTSRGAPPHL